MIGGSKVTITKSDGGSNSIVSILIAVAAILLLLYLIGFYYKKRENCVDKEQFETFNNREDEDEDEDSISSILDNNPLVNTHQDTQIIKKMNKQPRKEGNNCLVNQFPIDEYPKDKLSPAELLPADSNSKWAQVNPSGQGELGDQNFLEAGFHIGINSVGQSLRNPNLQLRSEPPCPQVQVSPWLQSTIDPDLNKKGFEIGSC
jgi:hypothetical protein